MLIVNTMGMTSLRSIRDRPDLEISDKGQGDRKKGSARHVLITRRVKRLVDIFSLKLTSACATTLLLTCPSSQFVTKALL